MNEQDQSLEDASAPLLVADADLAFRDSLTRTLRNPGYNIIDVADSVGRAWDSTRAGWTPASLLLARPDLVAEERCGPALNEFGHGVVPERLREQIALTQNAT